MLELIHSDLCEFEGILTCGENRYIITFIDDFSKYTTVYLLKNKSDTFEKFQDFLKEVENQFSRKIKRIRSCKDQIWLESRIGMDPGPHSPNNKFIECRRKS